MAIVIYHNPRCSKSRQTLALLEANDVAPKIVQYLDESPSKSTLKSIAKKLQLQSAREMMRRGEVVYKDLSLGNEQDEEALFDAMVSNPILIERPIVVNGDKAAIGRPPEAVLEIL